jgi:hypothetical protein
MNLQNMNLQYVVILFILIILIVFFQFYGKENFINSFITPNIIKNFNGLTNNSDTPWTIDKPTKLIITDIIRKILNMINTQTGMSYQFTAYDQLTQQVLSYNKTRFTADIFTHEMRNLMTRRILLIFVVDFAKKTVDVEYINLSNTFKSPTKDFMDYSSSNLILQDNNLEKNKYQIMGINASKIDFSILKDTSIRKDVPTPTEFQKWILPMGIGTAYQNPQAIFPSRRQTFCWDSHGINKVEPQTALQMGIKNTPLTRYPYPYFNPTVNRQREWDTEYKWLFDLNDNRGGIGRGVAGSP